MIIDNSSFHLNTGSGYTEPDGYYTWTRHSVTLSLIGMKWVVEHCKVGVKAFPNGKTKIDGDKVMIERVEHDGNPKGFSVALVDYNAIITILLLAEDTMYLPETEANFIGLGRGE